MNEVNVGMRRSNAIIRWAARIIGLLLISVFALFFFGQGPPSFSGMEPTALYMFIALFICMAGLIAGWKWELTGGILATGGVLVFYIINFISIGKFPGGPVFPLFFVPGILYLVSWGVGRGINR